MNGMTTREWLRTAGVGDDIIINRDESAISGTVTGLRVETERVDVSTGTRDVYLPGRSRTFVNLDPWRIEIELTPSDTILDRR